MSNALNDEDIQKVIDGINKINAPIEKIIMSVSKMTDKNGAEKIAYTVDGLGSIILSKDAEGIYKMDRMEGKAQELLCVTFNAIVKHYTGKDWPDQ